MRTRLSRSERQSDILAKARHLILARGLANTEMEDIRQACGISRGGLYHHYANKRAILAALIKAEVEELAQVLVKARDCALTALLTAGSAHLGAGTGILSGLQTREERVEYLSCLEQAFDTCLREPLRARLQDEIAPEVDPGHVAELFLTINAHINRREILGDWSPSQAASFAATALRMMAPMLRDPRSLDPIMNDLTRKAVAS